jgi:hypothetical protein
METSTGGRTVEQAVSRNGSRIPERERRHVEAAMEAAERVGFGHLAEGVAMRALAAGLPVQHFADQAAAYRGDDLTRKRLARRIRVREMICMVKRNPELARELTDRERHLMRLEGFETGTPEGRAS